MRCRLCPNQQGREGQRGRDCGLAPGDLFRLCRELGLGRALACSVSVGVGAYGMVCLLVLLVYLPISAQLITRRLPTFPNTRKRNHCAANKQKKGICRMAALRSDRTGNALHCTMGRGKTHAVIFSMTKAVCLGDSLGVSGSGVAVTKRDTPKRKVYLTSCPIVVSTGSIVLHCLHFQMKATDVTANKRPSNLKNVSGGGVVMSRYSID